MPTEAPFSWEVSHRLLSRSSMYADAASLLIEAQMWQAAAPVARSIYEDTATLGYIAKQDGRHEDFAELFACSDALDNYRLFRGRCKVMPELNSNKAAFSDAEDPYLHYRDKASALGIAAGKPASKLLKSWNDLTVDEMLKTCQLDWMYEICYRELCQFAHPTALGCSFGFGQREDIIGEPEGADAPGTIGVGVAVALIDQLPYVKKLTGVELEENAAIRKGLSQLQQFLSLRPHVS